MARIVPTPLDTQANRAAGAGAWARTPREELDTEHRATLRELTPRGRTA